jgi:hypothetical protein
MQLQKRLFRELQQIQQQQRFVLFPESEEDLTKWIFNHKGQGISCV